MAMNWSMWLCASPTSAASKLIKATATIALPSKARPLPL